MSKGGSESKAREREREENKKKNNIKFIKCHKKRLFNSQD